MGNHIAEVVDGLPSARNIKVHARMCSELLQAVIRVSRIFPEIEGARPGCSSGIDALCLLNNGIVKAKSLLQHCSESSVLYLALTGEAILSRCKKSRNLLEQSLCQIQNMVPVMLAAKISGIIADLRSVRFHLEPIEEEAGRVLRELLHRYGSTVDSTEEAALSAIHTVSSHLHISSQTSLLIEKRSIKRLIDKFGESEPSKKKILLFLLNLLNKYGKIIGNDRNQQDGFSDREDPFPFSNPYSLPGEVELRVGYGPNVQVLSRPVPPEEFMCPLSSRLMYDPVVISSGQTYERMWIQKWFDEGNDICPKTKRKLTDLSFTSNTGIKDLITKWCTAHNLSVPDPQYQESLVRNSWETPTNSIVSMTSSMNDLYLPSDYSNVSFGLGPDSDLSYTKMRNDVKKSREIDPAIFSEFSTLPWDSQCDAVGDLKRVFELDDGSLSVIPFGKFVNLILRFLKDARDRIDVEAQMTGFVLLCEFVEKHGNDIPCIKEDDYVLLASFLDTQFSKQALNILAALSSNKSCRQKIAQSGALTAILNILDGKIQDLLEPALKILTNLSSSNEAIATPSDFIPKLVPLLEDDALARYAIAIFKNVSGNEDARISIAESKNCIDLIAKLLEKDDLEDQECAVSVLLSLCLNCGPYCKLVMEEGVIPGLVTVSINGNQKAKAMAMELLRILKDEFNNTTAEEIPAAEVGVVLLAEKQCKDEKAPTKRPGLFGKLFSKPRAFGGKKKR
ncbi:hypothetical protein ABFS82_12G036800 [Erythranthe guttata]